MQEIETQGGWVDTLVDCPGGQGVYTYAVPSGLVVQPGDILSVPFGPRQVGAIALRQLTTVPNHLDPQQIRPIEAVVHPGFFAPTYWQLLERVASYYQTPLIQVLRTALPPGLLAKSQRRIRLSPSQPSPDHEAHLAPAARQLLAQLRQSASGDYTWQYLRRLSSDSRHGLVQLLHQGWVESYLAPPQPPRPKQRQAVTVTAAADSEGLSPRQQEILAVLRHHGGDLWLQEALRLCGTTSTTLNRLATKGYLVIEPREVLRLAPQATLQADQPKSLTTAQQKALTAIQSLHGQAQVLLHGITGSGKTEVYLQAIAPRLAAGQSALVLVPEIGLTPQLTDRFRQRFGDQVCVYHSALAAGERYDIWRHLINPQPRVVIGTRSAVFAPLSNLGLIVLDEEHDSSFKQDQPAPCYHARTVARWRAELAQCPLVLGSATPSLDTWSLSTSPALGVTTRYLSLPERIQTRPLPPIQVVDMRQELQAGNRSIFSRQLRRALQAMKAAGNQGLLFIQRRGHSSFVSCRSCGYVFMCPYCAVSLTYHQPGAEAMATLQCHHCGYGQAQPRHCPQCQSPYLKQFGSGTQRVMGALAEQLPELRCLRFDRDTTRTKGAHRHLLRQFAQGEADVLVGTQMLTKGIDMPQVTLVGIVAADGLLYMADYWASERTYQTLIQVAGRAGRGSQPGQVILQTYTPEHPVIEAVQRQDYHRFIETEWEQRTALGYPPQGRLILLRLSSPDFSAVKHTAEHIAAALVPELGPWECLGPVPAQIPRVARRYRWQILLKAPPETPAPALTWLQDKCPAAVSLSIDVDPLTFI
ncbi:primosomal protein N' [Halomicronema hongdechloris]|uniref:primosomal protein N' n=1 Tax=Halomicronema hongdechloris TaxID=1209493 RepID=UPI0009CB4BC9|nr:primosomal protein N' [Halomicronema hongdechloris]